MQVSKKTIKILIISIALFVLAVGGYSYLVYFVLDRTDTLATVRQQITAEGKRHDQFVGLEKTLIETTDKRTRLNQYVVGSDEVATASLIDSIQALADTSKVKMDDNVAISVEPIPSSTLFEFVKLRIIAQGTIEHSYQFLKLLESYPSGAEIGDATFELVPGVDKSQNEWRIAVMFRVIKQKK